MSGFEPRISLSEATALPTEPQPLPYKLLFGLVQNGIAVATKLRNKLICLGLRRPD